MSLCISVESPALPVRSTLVKKNFGVDVTIGYRKLRRFERITVLWCGGFIGSHQEDFEGFGHDKAGRQFFV